ncbi:fungal-specific transcription factor domain-containing protein [Aspergillus cavernicola]|uniref:Fungal-specific transcription factor domain-containing protein n=1 Tax=Aspergillus cavernicola TaxID=176166 RepID=A0ABR4I743_9EURO
MDAKNSHPHSTPLPPVTDHGHLLPIVAPPAAWVTSHPSPHHLTTSNNNFNTINQNFHHHYHHHPPTSISPSTPSPPQPLSDSAHAPHPSSSMVGEAHDEANVLQQPIAAEPARQDTGKSAVTKVRKPRKQGNAAQGRSTLFWVHNDPQSVAEGTREETLKLIRSHVMSEHNRKKRLENNKRYKSKAWKHLAFQPVETAASASTSTASASAAPESSHQASRKTSRKTARLARPPPFSSSSSASESSSPEPKLVDEEQEAKVAGVGGDYAVVSADSLDDYVRVKSESQELAVTQDPSPWTYVGQGMSDPFNTVHTQLSDRMYRHLQHFLCKLTRLAYPLQRHYGAKLEAHWASLVQHDPASLHACICVAATNSALESGEFPLTDDKKGSSVLLLDTFHHRGETIRLVNEGLSDPIKAASDELIAAVSVLLTVEIATGDPDYLKIHLAGLRQMVGMRNSFADVADDVRFQISWTDIRVACMSLTKPIFPFVRYTRPKNFTITPPTKELEATASSLVTLIQIPGIFNDVMSKVIYDLADLVWYAEWIKGGPDQEFDEETECYYNTEVLYVEYALHSDRYTSTGEVKGDATIEGCVRLACLLFHNSAIWDFYPQIAPVFPKPIIALQMALESTIRAGCYHLCRDLLIWLLFVGACSTRIPDQRSFFVDELASAMRLQGVRSWQELRAILIGYFYVDRCYLGPLRVLWDELQTTPAPHQCINRN